MILKNLREKAGVLLLDWRRYSRAFNSSKPDWIYLCNRREKLIHAPDGTGVQCDWRWSSELHAPKQFPYLGLRLMKRAFADYPISLSNVPHIPRAGSEKPEVSFVIGHKGTERLPSLLLVLNSIAGQCGAKVECIVVEQSTFPEIKDHLPSWVRYIHQYTQDSLFSRSRAFNEGARAASGEILVLHDNDLLVPRDYAADLSKKAKEGYEVINLKRFIFYLSRSHAAQILEKQKLEFSMAPEIITQNTTGGGSLAATKEAYFKIGGFDESFFGWGGEDVEFWERTQTLKLYPYGHLPFIHLWHLPQPGKTPAKDTPGMRRWAELSKIPVGERIEELNKKNLKKQ